MYNNYCKKLSKEILKNDYGVLDVVPPVVKDGLSGALVQIRVDNETKIIFQKPKLHSSQNYYMLNLYNSKLKRYVMITFSRVLAAWYFDKIPAGFVVDHKNNDKLDNRLENLQIISVAENINKDRECCATKALPVHANPSKEKYLNKLTQYVARYKTEKALGDQEAAHKTCGCIHAQKSKLLNYMSEEEYFKIYYQLLNT